MDRQLFREYYHEERAKVEQVVMDVFAKLEGDFNTRYKYALKYTAMSLFSIENIESWPEELKQYPLYDDKTKQTIQGVVDQILEQVDFTSQYDDLIPNLEFHEGRYNTDIINDMVEYRNLTVNLNCTILEKAISVYSDLTKKLAKEDADTIETGIRLNLNLADYCKDKDIFTRYEHIISEPFNREVFEKVIADRYFNLERDWLKTQEKYLVECIRGDKNFVNKKKRIGRTFEGLRGL